MKQYLPNYKDGSIVNLMASIIRSRGGNSLYKDLKCLSHKDLDSKNVVIMVIDGLGYEYLMKRKDSFLAKNMKQKITSVFPSTTASAITTFLTGLAPKEHAVTGWYMFLKEVGLICLPLRFTSKLTGEHLDKYGVDASDVFNVGPFRLKDKRVIVLHKAFLASEYNSMMNKGSLLTYLSLDGFFRQMRKAISLRGRKLVYAYWGDLDSIIHRKGNNSKEAENHFREIDKGVAELAKKLEGTGTTLIVTSDHGLIDIHPQKRVLLSKHPKLDECLSMPLSGETRVRYCYVHPDRAKDFENYVKKNLSKVCWMYKSKDLVKKGWFGLFEANPKLMDRIGDYVLVMKDNHGFKDDLTVKKKSKLATHCGVTKEEMFVPLIVIKN